jgi:mono/diheme cytochrome c family protein
MKKRLIVCGVALLLCLGATGLSITAQDMGGGDESGKEEPKKEEPKKEEPKGDGIKRKDVPEEYAKLEAPDLKSQETVDAGKKTYSKKCAGCHGDAGQSDGKYSEKLDPKATKLADEGFQKAVTDQYIFWRIKKGKDGYGGDGKSKMKSFGSMKDKEIWELVAFVRSLAAPRVEILDGDEFEDVMKGFKSANRSLRSAGHDKEAATKAGEKLQKLAPKLAGYDGDHNGKKARDEDNWKKFVKQMEDAAKDYTNAAKAEEWEKADAASKKIGETCKGCHHEYRKRHR